MEIKVKAIQITLTESEYDEIKTAADATKRSLASFALYSSLVEARKVNEENATK